ncbi:MAG TPA: hypothetical protein VKZ48_01160 [Burkholderiales bacterium]|nr:hypothetical protein [Burkholderiales bacterium]
MNTKLPFATTSLRVGAGFLIWAAHFAAVYVYVALVCARGDPAAQWLGTSTTRLNIGLITLIAVALLGYVSWQSLRGTWHDDMQRAAQPFLAWLGAAIALFGLLAVLWTAMPAIWVALCRPV